MKRLILLFAIAISSCKDHRKDLLKLDLHLRDSLRKVQQHMSEQGYKGDSSTQEADIKKFIKLQFSIDSLASVLKRY